MIARFFALLGSVGAYFVAFLVGAVAVYALLSSALLEPMDKEATQEIRFEVKEGWNIKDIAKKLEEEGLVRHWWSVYSYWQLLEDRVEEGKEGNKILVGEYKLLASQTPKELLNTLLGGKTVQHLVEIGPGLSIRELPSLIARTGIIEQKTFATSLFDPVLMTNLSIPANTPEGFIVSGRYGFSKPITARQVLQIIIARGKEKFDNELDNWRARASQLGYRPYEIRVLASLIEKIAETTEERKKISSVLHNRLRIGMNLQSNEALAYGIRALEPDFDGTITEEWVQTDSPYNTFLNTGLPPTPICSPSIDAMQAALYPAETDYLYYVPLGNSTFDYSSTPREHQEKLDAYFSSITN